MNLVERVEKVETKVNSVETGKMEYNSLLTNVEVNAYSKVGNVVHCCFRGQASETIENNSVILTLPYKPASNLMPYAYASTWKYSFNNPVFTYANSNNKNLYAGEIAADRYFMLDMTYITNE